MKHYFTILALCLAVTMFATTVNYEPDNETIFSNPERGFITMLEGHLSTSNPYCIKGQEDVLDAHATGDKGSLILAHYYLENFRSTSTMPEEILNAFDEDMQVLRDKGMKAIVRFSYTNTTYTNSHGDESAKDAPLSIAKSHINQYKSHWQANADVIFCFQAGFIGAWGEWYYTDNYGNMETSINDARRELVDALLAAVPKERCIQLRTPLFKTSYIGNTSPLTLVESYTGTAKARLAHHNDAFLADYTDMGTYTNPDADKAYLAQETLYLPIGGESCILDDYVAETNASYENTIAEMSYLHWTFIQSGYSTVVTNKWRANGTFDELNRRLGYRFQLIKGTFSDEAAQSGKFSVNLQLKNVGFAPLYNKRNAYILLKNGANLYTLQLASDPRTWKPNGEITVINEQLTVPTSLPQATYDLYLYLPDDNWDLRWDTKYNIRCANKDMWDEEDGINNLHASVKITAEQSPLDPPPTPPFSDAIVLPGTLNKANVDAFSSDMTWYNTDYFDFGPEDAQNLDRWAEWKVELKYPGKYIVSEEMASVLVSWGYLCHLWKLQLLSNDSPVNTYNTEEKCIDGEYTYDTPWDLSAVPTGNYILRVQNMAEWAQPKLQSLTLAYDGDIPSANEQIKNQKSKIINIEGSLYILRNGHMYTLNGQMIK